MLLMGKSTISMAIFHCYVSSPEGISLYFYILPEVFLRPVGNSGNLQGQVVPGQPAPEAQPSASLMSGALYDGL